MGQKPYAFTFLILLIGCSPASKPSDENFLAGLNKHFDTKNECLFDSAPRFPYELGSGPGTEEDKKRMEALAKAGLLKRENAQAIKMVVYTPTPLGEHIGTRFCYGHRHATALVSSTAPVLKNGFNESDVTYRYVLMDVPVWAKTDEMLSAFPKLKRDLSGEQTAVTSLAQTGAGWQVPE